MKYTMYNKCRIYLLALLIIFTFTGNVNAADLISVDPNGVWSDASTWGLVGGGAGKVPDSTDNVTIQDLHSIMIENPGAVANDINFLPGSALNLANDLTYSGRDIVYHATGSEAVTITGTGKLIPQATNWYVRPQRLRSRECYAQGGVYDGKSRENPFYDLNGIDWTVINEADHVILFTTDCEDYPGFIRRAAIQASGKPEYPITIRSDDPDNLEKILPAGIGGAGGAAFSTNPDLDISNLVIRDIIIDGRSYSDDDLDPGTLPVPDSDPVFGVSGSITLNDVTNVLIKNVHVNNAKSGITVGAPHFVIIEDSTVDTVWAGGIAFNAGPEDSDPAIKGGNDSIIRNNVVTNSLGSDGITVHEGAQRLDENGDPVPDDEWGRVNDVLGKNFQVLNNELSFSQEEGIDITSGTNILVQGNTTHDNSAGAAVIAHSAGDVTYIGNYSYNEGGVRIVNQDNPNSTIAYNIFNSTKTCINSVWNLPTGSRREIYNNTCFSNGGFSAIQVWNQNNGEIIIKNNIIVSGLDTTYLARIFGTPAEIGVTFDNNLWYHVSGDPSLNHYGNWDPDLNSPGSGGFVAFYDFNGFTNLTNVNDTLFADPAFVK